MPVNIHDVQSMLIKAVIPNTCIFTARISTMDIWQPELPVEIPTWNPFTCDVVLMWIWLFLPKIRYPAVLNLIQIREYFVIVYELITKWKANIKSCIFTSCVTNVYHVCNGGCAFTVISWYIMYIVIDMNYLSITLAYTCKTYIVEHAK